MTAVCGGDNPRRRQLLIIFVHGLGDSVQLQIVLRHLRDLWPDWDVDVEIGRGKGSAVRHLCRRVFEHGVDAMPSAGDYDRIADLGWYENYIRDPLLPQTKPINCLREVFRIEPQREMCFYELWPTHDELQRAREYLDAVTRGRKALLLHYQGNTSEGRKNLPHNAAAEICTVAKGAGWCVIILDWDGRTPLVDNVDVFNPGTANPLWGLTGTGDAAQLAALALQCDLFIGVDSGPLHVAAGCTGRPAAEMGSKLEVVGVWLEHSPVQFCDLGTVTHLVPADWASRPPVNGSDDVELFARSMYHLVEYPVDGGLHTGAVSGILQLLSEHFGMTRQVTGQDLVGWGDWTLHRHNVHQDLIIIRDIFVDDAYQTGHLPDDAGPDEVVVDIGAHIGVFARKWHSKNRQAKIVCVEVCPENIEPLQCNAGTIATILQGACTYDAGPLWLKNSVRDNCASTGGSTLMASAECTLTDTEQRLYRIDRRPIERLTLERIMEIAGVDHIDVLKLDCEGSEFDILENSPAVHDGRVRFILGEYHGRARWDDLRARRCAGWDYGHMGESGDLGIFHLRPMPAGQALKFRGYLKLPHEIGGDWKTSQQVNDRLAVGSFLHIPDFERHGWRVLTLAAHAPEPSNGLRLPLIDGIGNDPDKLRAAVRFVVDEWAAGRKVFVTCRSGANRSPAIAAAALAVAGEFGGLMSTAYEWLRSVRREVGHRGGTAEEVERAIQPMLPPQLALSPAAREFMPRLAAVLHPDDRHMEPTWLPYYGRLFDLVADLGPRRFVEIGVRAGYSAFTILAACPQAIGYGIENDSDTHGGRKGLYRHALQINPADRYHVVIDDSQQLTAIETRCDLVYVDADHSYAGCLHDLRLAETASDVIVVDDVDSCADVRQACAAFAAAHPEFARRDIPNGLTGFCLFSRSN